MTIEWGAVPICSGKLNVFSGRRKALRAGYLRGMNSPVCGFKYPPFTRGRTSPVLGFMTPPKVPGYNSPVQGFTTGESGVAGLGGTTAGFELGAGTGL